MYNLSPAAMAFQRKIVRYSDDSMDISTSYAIPAFGTFTTSGRATSDDDFKDGIAEITTIVIDKNEASDAQMTTAPSQNDNLWGMPAIVTMGNDAKDDG